MLNIMYMGIVMIRCIVFVFCLLNIAIGTVDVLALSYDTISVPSVSLQVERTIAEKLTLYRDLLEHGTYGGQDWPVGHPLPKSRFESFKKAFELFESNHGKVVVELGTSRSFTHGGHIGCNSDDSMYWTPDRHENWDWGAGFFTRMSAICLEHLNPEIHTIDLIASHIQRCKIMTQDYKHILRYHVCSSVDFLAHCKFPNGIDLLYLDTGDMTPIEPSELLQLEEAKVVVQNNLIAPKGLILIDDVRNQTPRKFGNTTCLGKSTYALPYLLANGFEIILDEYQVLLQKKSSSDSK